MDQESIARQAVVEWELFGHIQDALRSAIAWEGQGEEFSSRKLAIVRFMAHSFQRHLERLLALEENDGYMVAVLETQPRLGPRIEKLRREHEQFRAAIREVMPRLDRVAPTDQQIFQSLCGELRKLMRTVDGHNRSEDSLVAEGLLVDIGGESGA